MSIHTAYTKQKGL